MYEVWAPNLRPSLLLSCLGAQFRELRSPHMRWGGKQPSWQKWQGAFRPKAAWQNIGR